MAKVFIGVGHGGMDSGALGGGLREADVNLVMALTMAEELRRHGVQVAMSRTRDENDPLEEEITEANVYGPDLAIDVHNNAGGGDGFECYVQTNQYAKMSRAFGEALEGQVKALGQNSRGSRSGPMRVGTITDFFAVSRPRRCWWRGLSWTPPTGRLSPVWKSSRHSAGPTPRPPWKFWVSPGRSPRRTRASVKRWKLWRKRRPP